MLPWLDAGLRIVEVYAPLACFGNQGSHFLKAVVGILVMFVRAGSVGLEAQGDMVVRGIQAEGIGVFRSEIRIHWSG